jgi:hypothetical protein
MNQAKTAAKMGLVVTRTTELATVVSIRDSIQNRKCSERKKPATMHRPTCLRDTADLPAVFKCKGRRIKEAKNSL